MVGSLMAGLSGAKGLLYDRLHGPCQIKYCRVDSSTFVPLSSSVEVATAFQQQAHDVFSARRLQLLRLHDEASHGNSQQPMGDSDSELLTWPRRTLRGSARPCPAVPAASRAACLLQQFCYWEEMYFALVYAWAFAATCGARVG
jgi:hypothetical protein